MSMKPVFSRVAVVIVLALLGLPSWAISPPARTVRVTVEEGVENDVYRLHHKRGPVTDKGRLQGCVTTRDVQRVPRNQWATTTVGHIAGKCEQENTIAPTRDAMEALSQMSRNGTHRIMVVEGDRLVGLLSLSDLMKFIALKIELDDGGSAGSDGLPRQARADGISRALETREGSPNKGLVEAR